MNVQMVAAQSACSGGETAVPGAKKAKHAEADFWQLCLAVLGSGFDANQTLVEGKPLPVENWSAEQETIPAAAVPAAQALPSLLLPDSMAVPAADFNSPAAGEYSLAAEFHWGELPVTPNVPSEPVSALAAAGTVQPEDSFPLAENLLLPNDGFKVDGPQLLTSETAEANETLLVSDAEIITSTVPGRKLPAPKSAGPDAAEKTAAETRPQLGAELKINSLTAPGGAERVNTRYQAAGIKLAAAETERTEVDLQHTGRTHQIFLTGPEWRTTYTGPPAASEGRESFPLQSAVVKQVAQSIIFTDLPTGEKKLYVRLKPETLGEVEIRLRLHSGHLTAEVITDNLLVKQVLDASLGQLRERLQAQQITIAEFTVNVGQGQSQAEQQTGQQTSRQQQFISLPGKAEGLTAEIPLPAAAAGRQGLDLRA